MSTNDLILTHWERELKNRMMALSAAVRDDPLMVIINRASSIEDAAKELRLRAIALGFGAPLPKERE